jgi:lysozyme
MKRPAVLALVTAANLDLIVEKVVLVGIRGYYKTTMGDPAKNDRGIYDDAIFVIGLNVFQSYQANTDPSVYQKGIAVLVPGVYDCEKHMHKGAYPALQIIKDILQRDGVKGADTGRHGINIHHGGVGTWSEGCQSLPPDTWLGFQRLIYDQMDAFKKKTIKYILTQN